MGISQYNFINFSKMSRPTVSKMNSNDGQSQKISDRNLVDNSIMENSKNAAKLAVNSLDQIGRDQIAWSLVKMELPLWC